MKFAVPVYLLVVLSLIGGSLCQDEADPAEQAPVEEEVIVPENADPVGGDDAVPVEEEIIEPDNADPVGGDSAPPAEEEQVAVEEEVIVPENVQPVGDAAPGEGEAVPVEEEVIAAENADPVGGESAPPAGDAAVAVEEEAIVPETVAPVGDAAPAEGEAVPDDGEVVPVGDAAPTEEAQPSDQPNQEQPTQQTGEDAAVDVVVEEQPAEAAGTEAPAAEDGTQEAVVEVEEQVTEAAQPSEGAIIADVEVTDASQTEAPKAPEGTEAAAEAEVTGTVAKQETEAALADVVTEAAPAGTATGVVDDVTTQDTKDIKTEAAGVEVAAETTQAPVVVTTAEPEVPTTQEPEVPCEPADSPCCQAKVLSEDGRHVSKEAENDQFICDENLDAGWYGFKYGEKWAEVPTECIKEGFCSTQLAYRVDLGDKEMPGEGESINVTLATSTMILGKVDCHSLAMPVVIQGCPGGHFVYYFHGSDRCSTAVCTKDPSEAVPYKALGNPPVTQPPPIPTTEEPVKLNSIPYDEMTDSDFDGVVTVEYNFTGQTLTNDIREEFDAWFRAALAKKLSELAPNETEADKAKPKPQDENSTEASDTATQEPKDTVTVVVREGDTVDNSMNEKAPEEENVGPEIADIDTEAKGMGPGAGRRRRQADSTAATAGATAGDDKYKADDVYYMEPTPRAKDDKLQVSVVVREEDGSAVPADRVLEALEAMKQENELSERDDLPLDGFYAGVPKDLRPSTVAAKERPDIWESHMGLFIAVIVLCGICLLVILIGLLCIKCRGSGSWDPKNDKAPIAMEEGTKKKKPEMVIENPLPDEEITRDEAPMLERANPAVSPNGSGQHLKKEEDNGWVVPLDQLTDNEKLKPEMENTKL